MRSSVLFSLFIGATLIAGCAPKEPAPAPAPTGGGKRVDVATAGSVSGRAVFQGPAPAVETVSLAADRSCGAPSIQSDALIVSPVGEIKNVFVYVKDGLDPSYSFDPPSGPVTLSQQTCRYAPHVFGVRVGQMVTVTNDDPTLHNVHSLPKVNVESNKSTPIKGTNAQFKFTTPETMVRFKCDVHAWMAAYAGVVPHPFFAVTGADGKFELKDLPPGTYTIEAWHERFGIQTQQVTVGERQAQTISFTFAPKG